MPASPPGQDRPAERYEVVLDTDPDEPAAAAVERTARVSALDLDRIPDRQGVRLLVDAEQLARLQAEGLPVRVRRAVPVQPLDPSLIASDEDVTDWLSSRLGTAGPRTDEER